MELNLHDLSCKPFIPNLGGSYGNYISYPNRTKDTGKVLIVNKLCRNRL